MIVVLLDLLGSEVNRHELTVSEWPKLSTGAWPPYVRWIDDVYARTPRFLDWAKDASPEDRDLRVYHEIPGATIHDTHPMGIRIS